MKIDNLVSVEEAQKTDNKNADNRDSYTQKADNQYAYNQNAYNQIPSNLNTDNSNMELYLENYYASEYRKIRTLLLELTKEDEKLIDVMQDILVLLYDAQKEKRPPESIYSDNIESFCNRLLQFLSQKEKDIRKDKITKREKIINIEIIKKRIQKSLMKYRVIFTAIGCFFVGLIFFNILWLNGTIGVYKDGLKFLMKDNKYTIQYESVNTSAEIEVDLNNIESNIGKLIYDDGKCTIEIERIVKENNGIYNVFFRTHGTYKSQGGTLVTLIRNYAKVHTFPSDDLVDYSNTVDGILYEEIINETSSKEQTNIADVMVGRMQVILDGTPYACRTSTVGALNYKDGDIFGFTLFPLECYEEGKFLLEDEIAEQNGKVTLRLYNLIKTTWSRVS